MKYMYIRLTCLACVGLVGFSLFFLVLMATIFVPIDISRELLIHEAHRCRVL